MPDSAAAARDGGAREGRGIGGGNDGRSAGDVPLTGLHVLVIDDRSDDRSRYATWLDEVGATVHTARSIAEARQTLASWRIHAVLTDRLLQDGDGFEAFGRDPPRGSDGQRIAVVVTSGYFDEAVFRAIEQSCAVPVPKDHLRHRDVLAAFVRSALRRATVELSDRPDTRKSLSPERRISSIELRAAASATNHRGLPRDLAISFDSDDPLLLHIDEERVPLTAIERKLAAALIDADGAFQTTEQLCLSIWKRFPLSSPGKLAVHVKNLRNKLGRHAWRLQSRRGRGYRLRVYNHSRTPVSNVKTS